MHTILQRTDMFYQSKCVEMQFNLVNNKEMLAFLCIGVQDGAVAQQSEAASTRIRIFFNLELFLSGYENICFHTLCDHSIFILNSPVHTYSDSLRIEKIVPPGTGSSRSNPESSRTALISYSFKLFLPAVLSGR